MLSKGSFANSSYFVKVYPFRVTLRHCNIEPKVVVNRDIFNTSIRRDGTRIVTIKNN
ncbi:hypothetical protein F3D3_4748 [Fusibacter sp. 3D3]|nr:hypothetical protein F3D3_4748 [Fusibacter sp. 3D3]